MFKSHQISVLYVIVIAGWLSSGLTQADGPKDNLPDQVRRVPRLGIDVPAEQRERLEVNLQVLRSLIDQIRSSDNEENHALLPDVEIFYRAAHDALKYQEFFKESEVGDAIKLLRQGMVRADRLVAREQQRDLPFFWAGNPDSGLVVRGYKSKIDHSVQPYGLVVPKSYSHKSAKGYRLDVWFHGRGETMSENVFLTQRMNKVGVFAPKDTIVLHPYGRYSNAFKFAGEVDVLEAIEHVRSNYNIDDDRISVRGFSMGGAACWQFAVHYADRWFAANPGAGFSETPEFLKFFQKETLNPTWYEEKLWRMYDCNLWATNLLHCPTVAYSGEDDIQKQAADVMEAALAKKQIQLVHVIGPKTGHKYHPDAAAEVTRRLNGLAGHGRDTFPREIDFVTYTLKYNRMHWITVDSLKQHWEPATVIARVADEPRIDITASNVDQLTIDIAPGDWPYRVTEPVKVFVNSKGGDVVRPSSDRSLQLTLHRVGNDWKPGPIEGSLRKRHDLQGPIDDAFMDSFIFVRPTRQSSHPKVDVWANAELERAIEHWRRHFRGYARVKDDVNVTAEDIATSNLILWGDPTSNQLMGQISSRFPIAWDDEGIEVKDDKYDSENHALIAIYPNPINPDRYVVLNSSFTFREFAYLNNARQVPKLPDWAVVDVRTAPNSRWPGKIVAANFFDELWQLK